MNPMSEAPQDGRRILLKFTIMHYRNPDERDVQDGRLTPNELGRMRRLGLSRRFSEWLPSGEKWEECRWVSDQEKTGSEPHWEPWCGSERTHSTGHISEKHALGWLPLPDDGG